MFYTTPNYLHSATEVTITRTPMVLPTTTTAAVVPPTPPPVATPRPLANDHAIKGAFMLIILPYDTHALLDSCSFVGWFSFLCGSCWLNV